MKANKNYEKTTAFKFFRWMKGTKDPYVGEVEMHAQKHEELSEEVKKAYAAEKNDILQKVNDASNNKGVGFFKVFYKIIAILFCLALTASLVLVVSYLPPVGEATNPADGEVAQKYIADALEDTNAVNIVTGMILTYRAFDTFGETNVLFIATVCVMVSLMLEEKVAEAEEERRLKRHPEKKDPILQMAARILVPIILVFGIYIVLNGQNSPGGGFSGGAILGSALILYANAFGIKDTGRFFNEKVYAVCKVTALCMYGCIGLYYYTCGGNGIANHIPFGIPGAILSGGIILPIDICVGIEVACTMYAFYALFKRGSL